MSDFGNVVRVGINPRNTNGSSPVRADAHVDNKPWGIPFNESTEFDLGVFHPVCSKWAATTSISGNPQEHLDMIPSARRIAEEYCKHHIIENVPRAPLRDPTILNGRMFGMPIEYERAFETSFDVPQPPREKQLFTTDGPSATTETSSFFFSERSREWWAAVKNYSPKSYHKEHLAKNVIPASYIYYLLRLWLMAHEDESGISEGRVDYSDYDTRMDTKRKSAKNHLLDDFA